VRGSVAIKSKRSRGPGVLEPDEGMALVYCFGNSIIEDDSYRVTFNAGMTR